MAEYKVGHSCDSPFGTLLGVVVHIYIKCTLSPACGVAKGRATHRRSNDGLSRPPDGWRPTCTSAGKKISTDTSSIPTSDLRSR